MSTVIKIENLSKKYIIGHQQQERYHTFRDSMAQKFKEVGKKLLHPFLSSSGQPLMGLSTTEELWALKEVSFKVKQGERIGIIGRNGAGKTTLLKLLSRITEPTSGRISIKGRMASLLEVGTGFHPELTGRENIFLNGAILGMSRAETQRKFDEIVVFAEVEKFLDTPVKRYSTGMHVRLAFAVAAHLEPELLVVDEVLAVGDAEFQKKCLGKMEDVSRKEGRTVLFVSHNMAVIQSLCPRSLLLDAGRVRFYGPTVDAVPQYLATAAAIASFERPARSDGGPTITRGKMRLNDLNKNAVLILELGIVSARQCSCELGVKLHDGMALPIGYASVGLLDPENQLQLRARCNWFECRLQLPWLAVGHYFLSLQLAIPRVDILDRAEYIMRFDVDRPAAAGMQDVLRQEWNCGSIEIPLRVTCLQKGGET